MEVCRVCLAKNVRMYHMSEHQLKAIYERVTGIEIHTEDALPKELCWECVGRLSSANRFIQKALKTQLILSEKATNSKLITISDIDSIDKALHRLESTLGMKCYKVNEYNFLFSDETDRQNSSGNTSINQSSDQMYYEVNIKIEPDHEEENMFLNEGCINEEVPIMTEEAAVVVKEEVHSNQELPISVKVEYMSDKEVSDDDDSQSSQERRQMVGNKALTVGMEDYPKDNQSTILIQRLKMNREFYTAFRNNTFSRGDLEIDMEMSSSCTNSVKVPQCKKSFVNVPGGSSDEVNTYLSTLGIAQKRNKIILTRDDFPQTLFICDICNKSFTHKPTLKQHIQKHPKMHYCTFCSYKSYLKRNLFTHVNAKHTKSEFFNCPHCSYRANQKAHLAVHVNARHTKSNIFSCDQCSYKAYRSEHLTRHMNAKHTNSEILNCPYCSYKSSRECNLELHIKVKHTDSDFLSCSLCSYKTHRKAHLLRHVNTVHSKKEVFKCSYCIYKTFRKDSLEIHVNAKHTKSNLMSCSYCSYKTYRNSSLVKHVKIKHAHTCTENLNT